MFHTAADRTTGLEPTVVVVPAAEERGSLPHGEWMFGRADPSKSGDAWAVCNRSPHDDVVDRDQCHSWRSNVDTLLLMPAILSHVARLLPNVILIWT